ncbi:predicted protein [Naegleria gruberi]|uniref:Predicted protein n=1 Tax=Naegleria gruberi TaxID=5762 RepID=D2VMF2_NAEGR|nr:uncharacterized protein NAEGRDRAFT_70112 [Naegleria gruberi]EFC42051.1 predicted protein [Naegleria gruberi]|eukprot:XP_002674795.1 predicted protein [Naegleria gruberi strain NEG-M]
MYMLNKYFVPSYFPDEVNNALRLPLDSNDHKEQSILRAFSWLGIIEFCDMEIVRGECTLERNIKFIMDILDLIYSVKGFNNTEELKQQFTKDHNFINHICHNKDSVLANDMKLFSNEMSSKFKRKKLPDAASFKTDVEKANLHIQRYQDIIEELQTNIDEQHRGQSVVLNEQTLHTGGNYYIMSNLSVEHNEKIQLLGEAIGRFSTLVDQFMHVYHEEFTQWINPKPVEEKSQLEELSVSIPEVLTTLETEKLLLMNIKVIRYELHHQTDDSKPFVLYTIQIENRRKRKQLGVSSSHLENAELSGDVVPLNYSSPFDREYKYSYVEEFDDDGISTSSHSETTSNGGGGGASPNQHHHHHHHHNHNNQHHHESPRETCGFMNHSDWTVTKRYSELYDYHQRFIEITTTTTTSLQNSKDMKSLFPKKLIIGNLKKENIEKRVEQFNEYFKKMVDIILKEDNSELQKLVTHFFSAKPPLVLSESNPSKHPNKNIDWMIHKPNSRNNWFFSAPLGFEKFSTSFDRRAEYISPIFQNISIETLINLWEKFISKLEKVELVDSNHDICLYTYMQKASFINDFITVQFVQEIPPKSPETNTETTAEVTSPNKNEELDDTLSNMSPPNFESNVGDILKRFSIRRTTDFDIRDLLSDTSNNLYDDTQSTEEVRKPKFSIVIYSRSKFDLKDTNEKRVKSWLNDFKKFVLTQAPTVQLCNSFQWE